MTKPDYGMSRIYKIVSKSTKDIYFGCTICQLWTRKHLYRREYKEHKNVKSEHMPAYFSIICYDDFKLELVEVYECKCKQQLRLRLQHWIDRNNCINKKSEIDPNLIHPQQKTIEQPRFQLTKKTTEGVIILLDSCSDSDNE